MASPRRDSNSSTPSPSPEAADPRALELWSRYLGVQFKEVDPGVVADMTIATGDPRAIAPTISTGTGDAATGVNGIAGIDSVPSNADVTGLLTSTTGTITAGAFNFISSPGHGLKTGQVIQIKGVQGLTSVNGAWVVTVVDQDHFTVNGLTNSTGTYSGGGTWTLLNISKGRGDHERPGELGQQPVWRRGFFRPHCRDGASAGAGVQFMKRPP